MIHFPNVLPGSTLYIPWGTYSGSTGASITMSGLAVTDIEIYKNGSTTQRASDTGYTLLGTDFDAIIGIHGISIDLSSNANAGFYSAGSCYWVVISSVLIDGEIINFVLCTFTIGYPNAILNTTISSITSQTSFVLASGPAENDALLGCHIVVHDVASASQKSNVFVADYIGAERRIILADNPSFAIEATDNVSVFAPVVNEFTVHATVASVTSAGDFTLTLLNYAGNESLNGQFANRYLVFLNGPNAKLAQVISTYTVTGSTKRVQFTNARLNGTDAPFPNAPQVGNTCRILGLG